MRSVDQTARARIRDAAIELFGREGFDRTSVRAVAAAADVSPALVVHHFGSKEGLRDECDQHVLALVREGKQTTMATAAPPSLEGYLAAVGAARAPLRYLTRLLHEGGAAARRLYTGLVDDAVTYLTEAEESGVVRGTDDRRARATLLVSWGLANLLLGPLAADALGASDELAATGRVAGPALEIYTHGLFTDSRFLDGFRGGSRPTSEGEQT